MNTVLGRRAGSVDTRARGAAGYVEGATLPARRCDRKCGQRDIQAGIVGGEGRSWGERGDAAMTHEELLHGRPARISTRSTNHMWRGFARYGTQPACTSQPPVLRGAPPRERPRRRTVGPGRTDSSYRSRSIFVIRRRSKRNTNPAVGRAERRWTHATATASLAPANAPNAAHTPARRDDTRRRVGCRRDKPERGPGTSSRHQGPTPSMCGSRA